jgi:exoribonuclease-2
LPRGARLMARVQGLDLLTLDVHATLLARLDAQASRADADDEGSSDDDEDMSQASAPLALAIEVQPEDDGAADHAQADPATKPDTPSAVAG